MSVDSGQLPPPRKCATVVKKPPTERTIMVRRTIVPRVQKLKTQNKQKIIGQDGSMHRSCHPPYLQPPRYKQSQYVGEIRKRDPKLWKYEPTTPLVASRSRTHLYNKLSHSLHTIIGGTNGLRHCFYSSQLLKPLNWKNLGWTPNPLLSPNYEFLVVSRFQVRS